MQLQDEAAQPNSSRHIAINGREPHTIARFGHRNDDEIPNHIVNAAQAAEAPQSIVEIARRFLLLPTDSFALPDMKRRFGVK